jgi:hypothetical protein
MGIEATKHFSRGIAMEMSYTNMKSFMERYFRGYGDWVNSASTIAELDDYYTPEFTSTVYGRVNGMDYPLVRKGRQTFKDSLVRLHAGIAEEMTPVDIWIDEQRKKATALVRVKMTNKKTGEKLEVDMAAFYQLCLDERHTIKFASVGVFLSDPERAMTFYLKQESVK